MKTTALLPLHQAVLDAHVTLINRLLTQGIDINAQDEDGCTALHAAVSIGTKRIIKLLLSNKANVNIPMHNGWTALHTALYYRSEKDVVKLLLAYGAAVNLKDTDIVSPLEVALQIGHTKNSDIVELLLKHGADVHVHGKEAPLHRIEDKKTAELLLSYGADIEARDDFGNTLLHMASSAGLLDMVKVLLKHGANVYPQNNEGKTACMLATDLLNDCRRMKTSGIINCIKVVKLLKHYEKKQN